MRKNETLTPSEGRSRVSKKRRAAIWVSATLVAALAIGGVVAYGVRSHQVADAAAAAEEQAQVAVDATSAANDLAAATALLEAANTNYSRALSEVLGYAPKLEITRAAVDGYPSAFSEQTRSDFSEAVAEYVALAPDLDGPADGRGYHELKDAELVDLLGAEVPALETEDISADALVAAYQSGSHAQAAAAVEKDLAALQAQTKSLTAETERITTARAVVDETLVKLSASAADLSPAQLARFPKASEASKKTVDEALIEVRAVVDGTFTATPERMPTRVVYLYIQAVKATEKAHAAAVAAEKAKTEAPAGSSSESDADGGWSDADGGWSDGGGSWGGSGSGGGDTGGGDTGGGDTGGGDTGGGDTGGGDTGGGDTGGGDTGGGDTGGGDGPGWDRVRGPLHYTGGDCLEEYGAGGSVYANYVSAITIPYNALNVRIWENDTHWGVDFECGW